MKERRIVYELERDTGPEFSKGHVRLSVFDDGSVLLSANNPRKICLQSALRAEKSHLKFCIEQAQQKLEMVTSLLKRLDEESLE
jgi:hypothetical protein